MDFDVMDRGLFNPRGGRLALRRVPAFAQGGESAAAACAARARRSSGQPGQRSGRSARLSSAAPHRAAPLRCGRQVTPFRRESNCFWLSPRFFFFFYENRALRFSEVKTVLSLSLDVGFEYLMSFGFL